MARDGAALLLTALLALPACENRGVQFVMKSANDARSPLEPAPKDRARVVIQRHQEHFGRRPPPASVRIADDRGHVLGDVSQDSWFRVDITPGRHELYVWHDGYAGDPDIAAVCGDFAAGRVYYLDVVPDKTSLFQSAARFDWALGAAPLDQRELHALEAEPSLVTGTERNASEYLAARVTDGHGKARSGQCLGVRAEDGKAVTDRSFW